MFVMMNTNSSKNYKAKAKEIVKLKNRGTIYVVTCEYNIH